MSSKSVRRLLVVEDDDRLRKTLANALESLAEEVRTCETVAGGVALLTEWPPDLLLVDVALPDGTALDLLAAAQSVRPMPVIVAMSGAASPTQSFELGQHGVRFFLQKPLELGEVERILGEALATAPDLRPRLRSTVGHRGLQEVEAEVREVMVDEALARSKDSRRSAARLLKISRQLLQHILRRLRR